YGIPAAAFKAPNGMPINAVRGFLDMMGRLVSGRKPQRLAVATDEDWRPAFRVKVMPSYKTARLDRGAMPNELAPQEPVLWDVLRAIGVEVIGAAGFEAEDVIASLLPKVSGRIEIVTGDRDLFALVRDPDVCVLCTQQGIGRLVVVDAANAYIQQSRTVAMPVGRARVPEPSGTIPAQARDPKKLQRLDEDYGIASVTERLIRSLAAAA